MDEPIYRQPTPFRPVAQPGGGQIAVLSQPVGNGASLAAALMRGSGGGARSIGHGIGQAASKIAAAGIAKRDKEETAKRNEALARLLTDPNATPEQVAAGFAAAGDYSIAKDAYNRRVNPPKPEITEDATGRKRYLTGPSAGQYVFPDVQMKPKGGFVTLTNPKDNSQVTVRDDDPRADELIGTGYIKQSKPVAEVNVNTKGETKEAEEIGKFLGEGFAETQKAGDAARSALMGISRAEAVLAQTPTGNLESATLPLRQMAVNLGLFDKEQAAQVGAQEALRSIAVDFALKRVAETKGAVSNAEMDLFLKASVGLANSPQGNRLIIDGAKRIFQRQRELAALQRQYRRGETLTVGEQTFQTPRKGSVDGYRDFIDAYNEANPVFDDQFKELISGDAGQPEQKGDAAPIPPAPEGFTQSGWGALSPEERQEALELMGLQ